MTAPPDAGVPPVPAPLALRIPDAARAVGLSRSTIYRLAARGRLRLVRIGRRTVVDAASLRALLAGADAREGA